VVLTTAALPRLHVIIGLDLSAAFDNVQHDKLLNRLRDEFRVTSTTLSWLTTYIENREQYAKVGQQSSVSSRRELCISRLASRKVLC